MGLFELEFSRYVYCVQLWELILEIVMFPLFLFKQKQFVAKGRGLCKIEELRLYIFWFLFCKWGCLQIEGETLLLVDESMAGKNLYWNKYYTCWYSEEVSLPWMSSKRWFQNWYHFVTVLKHNKYIFHIRLSQLIYVWLCCDIICMYYGKELLESLVHFSAWYRY